MAMTGKGSLPTPSGKTNRLRTHSNMEDLDPLKACSQYKSSTTSPFVLRGKLETYDLSYNDRKHITWATLTFYADLTKK